MSRLSLKTRLGIRDYWDSPAAEYQHELQNLQTVLGTPILVQPEWSSLQAELSKVIDDSTRIPKVVSQSVAEWCKTFSALLDDDSQEEWTSMIVVKAAAANSLRVAVDVSEDQEPTVEFQEPNTFVLRLAPADSFAPMEYAPAYKEGLLRLFSPQRAESTGSWQLDTLDRAESTLPQATGAIAALGFGNLPTPAQAPPAYLPTVDALPRPEKLMAAPPYHLMVFGGGNTLEVHATHSPTLELLEQYLTKWCRTDTNYTDLPLLLDIKLSRSVWGLRGHDRLTLKPKHRTSDVGVTAPIVLSLAEKMGYALIRVEGSEWVYRRDQPFQG